MGINTVTIVTCDAPKCLRALALAGDETEGDARKVDTQVEYLQAGAYGFYAHKECFLSMTPVEVCKALGLDEVETEIRDSSGDVKLQQRVWSRWS